MPHLVETYLSEVLEVRRSGAGTKESSYYGALCSLLNAVGKGLKPKVRCIVQLANQGSGHPDLGLFTMDQFQRGCDADPQPGQKPSRGVIEAKAVSADVWKTARTEQVAKYLASYGVVLVTNFREFLLVGRDSVSGSPVELESCSLAADEATFWHEADHPRRMAKSHGDRLSDFLSRALRHTAPLVLPADVAWFLASYAREALARVEGAELPALDAVRTALEDSLGIKFTDVKGEHFFRSTLVQTIFYGVFSAWILWSKENPPGSPERFSWKSAGWYLRVPMISQLFERVATPTHLRPLELDEVLDWTTSALNRVDRASFFERFREEHAVQYFYEPFLQAFDPSLRKELGVWYTPPEVVKYMVGRVDQALREDLGIANGLADPRVHVLDPCAGTGAYLVGVLEKIAETYRENSGGSALDMVEIREAAKKRLHGFELLPAPLVVSHLQIGLLLQRLGVPLAEGDRVGVYLTNALTGWVPPDIIKSKISDPEGQIELEAEQLTLSALPGMAEERKKATRIKRTKPILVILGNPPYNGFAGVAMDEERDLSDAYRATKRAAKPQGQGLNDLYVRFFRMAERKIVEDTGRGIVCFISNYSWLDGLSFTGMRERYLDVFDRVTIDCLNGDKYKTGKVTPDGKPDPSVFSTEHNREGIQVGTAVTLLVKYGEDPHRLAFRFRSKQPLTEERVRSVILEFRRTKWSLAAILRAAFSAQDLVLAFAPRPGKEFVFHDEIHTFFAGMGLISDDRWADTTEENADELMAGFIARVASGATFSEVAVPDAAEVRFRHYWGKSKRTDLVAALEEGAIHEELEPPAALGYPFIPTLTEGDYLTWPLLQDLFPVSFPGVKTSRDDLVVDIDRDRLEARMRAYFNPQVSDEDMRGICEQALAETNRFRASEVRRQLQSRGILEQNFLRYVYRPMDVRWVYWEPETKLLDEKRAEYKPHVTRGNVFLFSTGRTRKGVPEPSVPVTHLCDLNCMDSGARGFPLLLNRENAEDTFLAPENAGDQSNLSPRARGALSALHCNPSHLFFHVISITNSEGFLMENLDALRSNWPRVPLPANRQALEASAALGHQVAALLDPEAPVEGITTPRVRSDLRPFGTFTLPKGHELREAEDFAVTARWGYAGRGGITMPARGELRERKGGVPKELHALLGAKSFDVMLNKTACWTNVPERVWEYTLGGYQVIKKWLSYRELELLGRPLRQEEVRHVEHMVRRIAALLLLAPALDENYRAIKADTLDWSSLNR